MNVTSVLIIFLSTIYFCGVQISEGGFKQHVPPFLEFDAEAWAFDRLLKQDISAHLVRIQNLTRDFFMGRRQEIARLPSYSSKVTIKNPTGGTIDAELSLRRGELIGLSNVGFSLGDILDYYDDLGVTYTSFIDFSKSIRVSHEFTFTTRGTVYRGMIDGVIRDIRYLTSNCLNLGSREVKMESFKRYCIGGIDINISGLPENQVLETNEIRDTVLGLYKGSIVDDVETLTHIAVGDVISTEKIKYLPNFNYSKIYCARWFRANPYGLHPFLPFIQNEAEMLAFERLLKERVNVYARDLLSKMTQDLVDRDLVKFKLIEAEFNLYKDDYLKFELERKGQDSKNLHRGFFDLPLVQLVLVNRWLSSGYNFENAGVEKIELNGLRILITWRMILNDKIQLNQNSIAINSSIDHRGRMKVTLNSMSYLVKLEVDLEAFHVEIIEFYMECKGEEMVESTGLEMMEEIFTEWSIREVKSNFKHDLYYFDEVLSKGFKEAIHTTKIENYLPQWNYKRNFTRDEGTYDRKPTIIACEESELEAERGSRNVVEHSPVPFIKNAFQQRVFADKLTRSMSDYMKLMLDGAGGLIVKQNLRKSKLPEAGFALNYKDAVGKSLNGHLILSSSWVEDLSEVKGRFDVNDLIKFDNKTLLMKARVPIWSKLEFDGDFLGIASKELTHKGQMKGRLNHLIYSLAMRADYLGTGTVTLDEFKLSCLGGVKVEIIGLQDTDAIKAISNVISTAYVGEVIRNAENIYRRSLEDKIGETDIRFFLPEWNYSKIYSEKKFRKSSFNRHDSTCAETSVYKVTAEIKKINKVVNFRDFLPVLRMETLRNELMKQTRIRDGLEWLETACMKEFKDSYAVSKLHDQVREFKLKDFSGTEKPGILKLKKGTVSGLSSVKEISEVHEFYLENDDIMFLAIEPFLPFTLEYDFELSISGKLMGSGNIKAEITNLENILKLRFDMHTRRFKLEEYYLHCFTGTIIEATGPANINLWLKEYEGKKVYSLILASTLENILDLRAEILSDCVEKLNVSYALPYWMYNAELFQIATRNLIIDERRVADRTQLLRECFLPALINTDEKRNEYKEKLPFIQTEAEWWYFDLYTKNAVSVFIDDLIKTASLAIEGNNFNKLNFACYLQRFTARDQQGKEHNGVLRFFNTVGEDLSLDHRATVEMKLEETFMTIRSYIRLKKKIEFRCDVEANTTGILQSGTVKGTVDSLTYAIKVRLNMKTNETNLEDFQLVCIGGVKVSLTGFDEKPWMSEVISGATRNYFVGIIMEDVDTIMILAIKMEFLNNTLKPSLMPPWNYGLDYSKAKEMKMEREASHYELCTQ